MIADMTHELQLLIHFRHYNIFTYRGYYSFYFVLKSYDNVYRLGRYTPIMEKEMRDPFQIIYMTRAGEHRHLRVDREQMKPPVLKAISRLVSREVSES